MNVITRGAKNALRSPLRSGAIVVMLAISIGLILSMMVARSSVNAKINEVKATTATAVTINPAGIQGSFGGGDPLTAEQVKTITATAHVSKVVSTLTDELGTADTNLVSALTLGSFGNRQLRFEAAPITNDTSGSTDSPSSEPSTTTRTPPTPRTRVTGTNDPSSVASSDKITSGTIIDGNSTEYIAMIGKTLAEKNSLKVGDTFTAYSKTVTVKAIFSTDNAFLDSGVVMPLGVVQTLTDQAGAVSNVAATIDSSENVLGAVTALKSSLGTKADITSEQEQAASSLEPLESIASLAAAGVIAAAVAGAAIILLTMVMIVRERRREIGVIKAIGGTNTKVITQFVSEALTLTISGAVVGLGLGVFVSGPMTQSLVSNQSNPSSTSSTARGVRDAGGPMRISGFGNQVSVNLTQVASTLTPQVFAASAGIIVLVAIVGSAVPAWFISRIRPAEVLRTE